MPKVARGVRTGTVEERLLASLSYDKDTGLFVWIKPPRRGVPSGSAAGHPHSQGYLSIGLGGKQHFAHRVAWLFAHGRWPQNHIDHINGDKKDNRIANLRDVEIFVNQQNRVKAAVCNKTGFLGVTQHECGRFVAQIGIKGKTKYLGMFKSPEDAHAVYLEAKRRLHEGCTI